MVNDVVKECRKELWAQYGSLGNALLDVEPVHVREKDRVPAVDCLHDVQEPMVLASSCPVPKDVEEFATIDVVECLPEVNESNDLFRRALTLLELHQLHEFHHLSLCRSCWLEALLVFTSNQNFAPFTVQPFVQELLEYFENVRLNLDRTEFITRNDVCACHL